jgi:tetratricopeptide (TPR) repeat protein
MALPTVTSFPRQIIHIPLPEEEAQRELSYTGAPQGGATCGDLKRRREDVEITLRKPNPAVKNAKTSADFEVQVTQSENELRQIEEEWQVYRHTFALKHFEMEDAEPLTEMEWSAFKNALRESFTKRLQCCEVYHEDQCTMEDDLLHGWNLKKLVHQKYMFQGALKFLDGNVEEAVELFKQAIALDPSILPAWLFLASALYRLEKYQEVIILVEKYNHDYDMDSPMSLGPYQSVPREFIFSLYSQFSLLGDGCIEQNFLQLTHPIYVNTEMYYYFAKARCALSGSESQSSLALVFYRRGIECMRGGKYHQAVFNFEKAKEVFPGFFLGDHYAKSLFVLGRIEEAIQESKSVVEMTQDDKQKVKYLNRLIDYYIQREKIGEADDYLEEIPKDRLSNLMHVHFAYLRMKIKLSLKNPSFRTLEKGVLEFFEKYQKLSHYSQGNQAGSWLRGCLELQDNFCKYKAVRGEIGDIINTHLLFIEKFDQLIASLEKAFSPNQKLEEGAHFPNWIYDRLYLSYFSFLMQQYLKFTSYHNPISLGFELSSERVQLSEELLSNYKMIEEKIKGKLQLFHLRCGWLERDESGISQEYENLDRIFEAIDILTSEDKTKSEEASSSMTTDDIQITPDEMMRECEELQRAFPNNSALLDFYRSSLKEARNSCADTEGSFFDLHVNIMELGLKLGLWPMLIKLSMRKELDKTTLVSNFESISMVMKGWLSILTGYQAIIENETHFVLKKAHLKALNAYQLCYFPYISRILFEYVKNLQEARCIEFASKAVELVGPLIQPLRIREESEELSPFQLQKLKQLFQDFDVVLDQNNKIIRQHAVTEISEQLQDHPLTLVFHGKKSSPYRVPFPSQQIIESLGQLKQTAGIREDVNLSVHYLTVVYHTKALDGTKTRKTYHLPLSPPQDFFAADQLGYPNQKYMKRIERGYQIYKEASSQDKNELRLAFQETAIEHDFSTRLHRHSEQAFFEWLSQQNLSQLIAKIKIKEQAFRSGCKVDMVAFDMGSSYDSCRHCRLSALSVQSGKQEQGDFLALFEKALLGQGYLLPREKDGMRLNTVTRILAESFREEEKANPHRNPIERNVKDLKNLGLFQHIIPNIFASGSSKNVKK